MLSRQSIVVGSRVLATTGGVTRKGEVCFIGETKFASGEWVGVRLDTPDGKNDGSVADVRYFTAEANYGMFVKRAQLKLDTDSKAKKSDSKVSSSASVSSADDNSVGKTTGIVTSPKTPAEKKLVKGGVNSLSNSNLSVLSDDSSSITSPRVPVKATAATPVSTTKTLTRTKSDLSKASVTKDAKPSSRSTIAKGIPPTPSAKVAPSPGSRSVRSHSQSGETGDLSSIIVEYERREKQHLEEISELKAQAEDAELKLAGYEAATGGSVDPLADTDSSSVVKDLQKKIAALEKQLSAQRSTPVKSSTAQKSSMSLSGDAVKVAELENQIQELNDTIESLTLDKEQLIIELEEKAGGGGGGDSHAFSANRHLLEENEKLREAVRRLTDLSEQDKEIVESQQEILDELERELEELRDYKESTQESLSEMKETVDSAAAFEAMIEKLSEQNLELSEQNAEYKQTIADLEDAHELSEELDISQRQQIEADRVTIDNLERTIRRFEDQFGTVSRERDDLLAVIDDLKKANKAVKDELARMQSMVSTEELSSKQLLLKTRENANLRNKIDMLLDDLADMNEMYLHSSLLKFKYNAMYMRFYSIYGNCILSVEETELLTTECSQLTTLTSSFDAGKNVSELIQHLVFVHHSHPQIQATQVISMLNKLQLLLLQSQCYGISSVVSIFTEPELRNSSAKRQGDSTTVSAMIRKAERMTNFKPLFDNAVQLIHQLTALLDAHIEEEELEEIGYDGPLSPVTGLRDEDGKFVGGSDDKVRKTVDSISSLIDQMQKMLAGDSGIDPNRILAQAPMLQEFEESVAPVAQLEYYLVSMNTFCNVGIHYASLNLEDVEIDADANDLNAVSLYTVDALFKAIKADIYLILNHSEYAKVHLLGKLDELKDLHVSYLSCFEQTYKSIKYAYPEEEQDRQETQAKLRKIQSTIRKIAQSTIQIAEGQGVNIDQTASRGLSSESTTFFPLILFASLEETAGSHHQLALREDFNKCLERYWNLLIVGGSSLIKTIDSGTGVSEVNWRMRTAQLSDVVADRIGTIVSSTGLTSPQSPKAQSVSKERHNLLLAELDAKKDELKSALLKCNELRDQLDELSARNGAPEKSDKVPEIVATSAESENNELIKLREEVKVLEAALKATEQRAEMADKGMLKVNKPLVTTNKSARAPSKRGSRIENSAGNIMSLLNANGGTEITELSVVDSPQYKHLQSQLLLWKKVAVKRLTDSLLNLDDPFALDKNKSKLATSSSCVDPKDSKDNGKRILGAATTDLDRSTSREPAKQLSLHLDETQPSGADVQDATIRFYRELRRQRAISIKVLPLSAEVERHAKLEKSSAHTRERLQRVRRSMLNTISIKME